MHEAVMEVLVLKKLSHPGIIKFYHSIRKDNYIGLLLELCPYGDVYMLIKNVNRNI
jgi:serine/threonine protein kinase